MRRRRADDTGCAGHHGHDCPACPPNRKLRSGATDRGAGKAATVIRAFRLNFGGLSKRNTIMELTDEEQLVVEQLAEEQSQKQLAADRERDRERERQLEWAKNFRRRFPPGQSGNPSGRPKGARNRVTLAMEAVFDAETE